MSKKVLIILAEGFEEIEAVTIIDVLRRAELDVVAAGVGGKSITGSHGIRMEADVVFEQYDELPDCIVLPGGLPGSQNLADSKKVAELVKKMNEKKKLVTAICAAPALALAPTGVLDGKKATCYPGFEKKFPSQVQFSDARVVCDGNVITSRGPGSSLEFSLELVRQLAGEEKASALREGLLVKVS